MAVNIELRDLSNLFNSNCALSFRCCCWHISCLVRFVFKFLLIYLCILITTLYPIAVFYEVESALVAFIWRYYFHWPNSRHFSQLCYRLHDFYISLYIFKGSSHWVSVNITNSGNFEIYFGSVPVACCCCCRHATFSITFISKFLTICVCFVASHPIVFTLPRCEPDRWFCCEMFFSRKYAPSRAHISTFLLNTCM